MQISYGDLIGTKAILDTRQAAALTIAAAAAIETSGASNPGTLPSANAILLGKDGRVSVKPADAAGEPARVRELARLMSELMQLDACVDDRPRPQVPGGLMLLLARALGQVDLPQPLYATLHKAIAAHAAPPASLTAIYRRAVPSPDPVDVPGTRPEIFHALQPTPPPESVRVGSLHAALAGVAFGLLFSGVLAWSGLLDRQSIAPAPVSAPDEIVSTVGRAATAPAREPAAPAARRAVSRSRVAAREDGLLASRTDLRGGAFSPSFSADGQEMVFHVGRKPASLMRASLDTRGSIRKLSPLLRDAASNYHVVESADGRSIAFDSDRDGIRGVYVARIDGSGVTRVSGDGYAAVPSWSPDGRTLAFIKADPAHQRVWNVWVADVASGQRSQITHLTVGQAWRPSWFPDNRRLAYSVENRLVVTDVARRGEKVYRSPLQNHLVRTPAVSPDGTRIVFQVYRDGVWLLDLATGSMTRILADKTAEEFSWAPDGQSLAYHARARGEWTIWHMSFSTAAE